MQAFLFYRAVGSDIKIKTVFGQGKIQAETDGKERFRCLSRSQKDASRRIFWRLFFLILETKV